MRKSILGFTVALFLFGGCATSFTGAPHVTKAYCLDYCKKNGLGFSGMVALGEYSSGCICTTGRHPSSEETAAAGAGAAAVGVVTQMRA